MYYALLKQELRALGSAVEPCYQGWVSAQREDRGDPEWVPSGADREDFALESLELIRSASRALAALPHQPLQSLQPEMTTSAAIAAALSRLEATSSDPEASRSLKEEFKKLNKKHGSKTYQKPCPGPPKCTNVLCDHRFAPPASAGSVTGDQTVAEPKLLELVMKKCAADDYKISSKFATSHLIAADKKLIPAIAAIKYEIDHRESFLHNSGRISVRTERASNDLAIQEHDQAGAEVPKYFPSTRDTLIEMLEMEDAALRNRELGEKVFRRDQKDELATELYDAESIFRNERAKHWHHVTKDKNLSEKEIERRMVMWEKAHKTKGVFSRLDGGVGSLLRRAHYYKPVRTDEDCLKAVCDNIAAEKVAEKLVGISETRKVPEAKTSTKKYVKWEEIPRTPKSPEANTKTKKSLKFEEPENLAKMEVPETPKVPEANTKAKKQIEFEKPENLEKLATSLRKKYNITPETLPDRVKDIYDETKKAIARQEVRLGPEKLALMQEKAVVRQLRETAKRLAKENEELRGKNSVLRTKMVNDVLYRPDEEYEPDNLDDVEECSLADLLRKLSEDGFIDLLTDKDEENRPEIQQRGQEPCLVMHLVILCIKMQDLVKSIKAGDLRFYQEKELEGLEPHTIFKNLLNRIMAKYRPYMASAKFMTAVIIAGDLSSHLQSRLERLPIDPYTPEPGKATGLYRVMNKLLRERIETHKEYFEDISADPTALDVNNNDDDEDNVWDFEKVVVDDLTAHFDGELPELYMDTEILRVYLQTLDIGSEVSRKMAPRRSTEIDPLGTTAFYHRVVDYLPSNDDTSHSIIEAQVAEHSVPLLIILTYAVVLSERDDLPTTKTYIRNRLSAKLMEEAFTEAEIRYANHSDQTTNPKSIAKELLKESLGNVCIETKQDCFVFKFVNIEPEEEGSDVVARMTQLNLHTLAKAKTKKDELQKNLLVLQVENKLMTPPRSDGKPWLQKFKLAYFSPVSPGRKRILEPFLERISMDIKGKGRVVDDVKSTYFPPTVEDDDEDEIIEASVREAIRLSLQEVNQGTEDDAGPSTRPQVKVVDVKGKGKAVDPESGFSSHAVGARSSGQAADTESGSYSLPAVRRPSVQAAGTESDSSSLPAGADRSTVEIPQDVREDVESIMQKWKDQLDEEQDLFKEKKRMYKGREHMVYDARPCDPEINDSEGRVDRSTLALHQKLDLMNWQMFQGRVIPGHASKQDIDHVKQYGKVKTPDCASLLIALCGGSAALAVEFLKLAYEQVSLYITERGLVDKNYVRPGPFKWDTELMRWGVRLLELRVDQLEARQDHRQADPNRGYTLATPVLPPEPKEPKKQSNKSKKIEAKRAKNRH